MDIFEIKAAVENNPDLDVNKLFIIVVDTPITIQQVFGMNADNPEEAQEALADVFKSMNVTDYKIVSTAPFLEFVEGASAMIERMETNVSVQ